MFVQQQLVFAFSNVNQLKLENPTTPNFRSEVAAVGTN